MKMKNKKKKQTNKRYLFNIFIRVKESNSRKILIENILV